MQDLNVAARVAAAAESIRARAPKARPTVALILGTGLGNVCNGISEAVRLPYAAIPHFPTSTVDAHAGELVVGRLAGKEVMALSGRFHAYEGYSLQEVTFPVRVAKALGVRYLIVANAAGGVNPLFRAGDLMLITDHINLMGDNPLIGPNDETLGPRFPDMSEPYDRALLALAETSALKLGIALKAGVYLACTGPCLETRAEYRFMRLIGADAIGMSTVPEVIVAAHAGLRVLGFSAITDECFPDALQPVDITRIIATAQAVEPKLSALIMECIEELPEG